MAFRETTMTGVSMALQSLAGSVLASGVPLFIMLTGYLNINKTISKKYYFGIWRVLIAYLFFSLLTMIFRHYAMGDPLSILSAVKKILDFSSFLYGWYIEMWIGLFLMIPFLNILYKGIETRRHKQILVLTLASLSFLPIFTNRYGQHPLPDFWISLYPLAFYFVGSYIREYRPKTSKFRSLLIVVAIGIIPPLFTMIAIPGHTQISILGDCFGIFGAISGILIFMMLYDVECRNTIATKIIYWISLLSLDIYLCCYIFDSMAYPWFKERYFVDQSTFGIYFFIIVPIVLFGAFGLSLVKRMIFSVPVLRQFR